MIFHGSIFMEYQLSGKEARIMLFEWLATILLFDANLFQCI